MILAEQPQTGEVIDRNQRDYDDLTTLFAEMVDGSMRTPFEYRFDGRELYARDGGAMGREFEKGLETADRIADRQPNLCFEVRRRRLEIDEYHDMLSQAAGKLPNTMVVVSDFPEELMDAPRDIGGYNVQRKQTMLRVLAWDGQRMKMYSQSLDRSDRAALEAMYRGLGYESHPGELLGQRMHVQLEAVEQSVLIDKLMGVYDHTLQQRFGGRWRSGIPDDGSRLNTYDFVREQRDIVQYALQEKRFGTLNIYKVAALLEERLQANRRVSPSIVIARHQDPFHDLGREMLQAEWRARAVGKIFSACGMSVEAPTEANLGGELSAAGYGNKTSEATSYKFDKKMHCVVCQAPPKKGEAKKLCGPCGICRSCDKALSKKS